MLIITHTLTQHIHSHNTCILTHVHGMHTTGLPSIKVAFSLTMNRNNIELINERILLSANSPNFSTESIHFYYPTWVNDQSRSPNVAGTESGL